MTRVHTSSHDDVVVVGAGVIGLSVAWRAAQAGFRVDLVDPLPGRGASWAAAGMLAPVSEAHLGEEPLLSFNLRAATRWPSFASDLEAASNEPVGYARTGTLLVASDVSNHAAVDHLLEVHRRLGLDARRRSAPECRTIEPLLTPGVVGGAELPDDHQVDNRLLLAALRVACNHAGVVFHLGSAQEIGVRGDRVTGVVLEDGTTLPAGQVVLAAGCRSGLVGGVPAADRPPVRPVKGLTLRLGDRGICPRLSTTVRGPCAGGPATSCRGRTDRSSSAPPRLSRALT